MNRHATSRWLFCSIAGLITTAGGCGSQSPRAVGDANPGDVAAAPWVQVWSDEFDGPAGAAPDSAKWRHDVGDGCAMGICGWGNEEKQTYTETRENASLDGSGHLAITARVAAAGLPCHYGPCRYTSAKLTTRGRMNASPGRVEARIRVPRGQGLWPAFWMLGAGYPDTGWPECGEIDIMEHRGSQPRIVSSAVHGPGYSGRTPFAHGYTLAGADYADDFHLFAAEWDTARVRFLVDDRVHFTVEAAQLRQLGPSVLGRPYFLILNLAVGGLFDGDPVSDAIFPATMLVDHVRVYRQAQ